MSGPRMEHNGPLAVRVGKEPPVQTVLYYKPESPEHDSGFSVLFSDAPEYWHGTPEQVAMVRTVCLQCLIEHHPEVGRGLDLAKQHGGAEWYPDTGWEVPDE